LSASEWPKETEVSKKSEDKFKAEAFADAEIMMTLAEFQSKFPIGHMRRMMGDGQVKVFGFYAFLDPATKLKTLVVKE
jgi:hypothetical protein